PYPRQRGLHGFLHDRPELTSHDEALVAAGHPARLDKQHIAANRGPREADRDAGPAGPLRHLGIGTEPGRAEVLLHQFRRNFDLLARALRDPARLLPANRADLALQTPYARLACVAPHQETHRRITELDIALA